jgi:heme-degrading monooxygenase HmoA
MSIVVINVLTVPGASGELLEERFAARAGLVEKSEGFEGFQLLRPTAGTEQYLVVTRWRSTEDFQRWLSSADFGRGHAQAEAAARGDAKPASTHSEIWQFDVVQDVAPS